MIFGFLLTTSFAQIQEILWIAPNQSKAGETFNIEYKILKTKTTFYSKMEINIPENCDVIALEKAGADFSSSNSKISFTWFRVPIDTVINVKLKFTPFKSYSGKFPLTGIISTSHFNQRKEINLPGINIDIIKTQDSTIVAKDTAKVVDIAECMRLIKQTDDKTWLVELKLTTPLKIGAAKLTESIPTSYKVFAEEKSGAEFVNTGQKVEFFWADYAEVTSQIVSYRLIPENLEKNNQPLVNGEFIYFKDNKKNTVLVKNNLEAKEDTKHQQDIKITNVKTNDKANQLKNEQFFSIIDINKAVKENKLDPVKAKKETQKAAKKKNKSTQKIVANKTTKTVKKTKDYTYRIEIYSSTKPVEPDFFLKYKYTGVVLAELYGKQYKYTIGNYKTKEDALNQKQKLLQTTLFPEAYVISYAKGKRVK